MRTFKYIGFALLGLGFIILAVFITMSLWNALIPALFHGPVLTFWQTAGLFILSKILLTGIAPGSRHYRGHGWRRRYYKEHFQGCREEDKTEPATV